ncbi:MAG: hypothetical protein A3F84_25510 [Candidatus Handelsmanbacteria bacterium RIFCSPLOWO2_12_FULL_64_10]|uniref:Cell division protein FtsL n=1 Tax=Handelsmanbacteria sp. (strain RIFCSPLOWO2_12_FULL_64_10) TaxID=1817868 RepID=A0A1F6C9Z9_HANXR|nr:MAG: hypothetical protein A3F84_25510 [Candidatus Handelsmanbacteria bacterium RIFCSPLOWO2_12_FULL_64_10]
MAGIAISGPWLRSRGPARSSQSAPRFTPVSERLVLSIGGALIFITAVLNFYVFQVSVVATSAYEAQSLERERELWVARNAQLQLELAKAQSLRWVEYESVQRLGMIAGDEPIYLETPIVGEATVDRPSPSGQSGAASRSADSHQPAPPTQFLDRSE